MPPGGGDHRLKGRHRDPTMFAPEEESTMGLLGWALIFLVVAGVAAVFGFGGVASAAAGVAKLLFFVFLAIFLVLLIVGLVGGSTPTA